MSEANNSGTMFGTPPVQSPTPLLLVLMLREGGQAVMVGVSSSKITIVETQVSVLFAGSVAVQVTTVVPSGNNTPVMLLVLFTLFLKLLTLQLSLAVAFKAAGAR